MKSSLCLVSLVLLFVSILFSCTVEMTLDTPTLEISNREVRNGDELTLNLIPGEKTNVKLNVTFYFEDEKIGTVSNLPYQMKYKIEDKAPGIYSLSYKANYKKKFGFSTSTASISGSRLIEILK